MARVEGLTGLSKVLHGSLDVWLLQIGLVLRACVGILEGEGKTYITMQDV